MTGLARLRYLADIYQGARNPRRALAIQAEIFAILESLKDRSKDVPCLQMN